MIRYVLTAMLLVGIVFALREWKQSRLLFLAIAVLSLGGIYFVWDEEQTTRIANLMGVGRGADLVLYVYSAISFVLIVSLLIRIKLLHEQFTDLTRAVALANARRVDAPPRRDPAEPSE